MMCLPFNFSNAVKDYIPWQLRCHKFWKS